MTLLFYLFLADIYPTGGFIMLLIFLWGLIRLFGTKKDDDE